MGSPRPYATEPLGCRAAAVEPSRTKPHPATVGPRQPTTSPPAPLVGQGAAALVQLIARACASWRERRQRKSAIGELRAWNDGMLKDIGLTRGEIVAAVDGQVYRGPVRPCSARAWPRRIGQERRGP